MKTVIISGGCGLLGTEFAKTLSKDSKVVILDLYNKVMEYRNSDAYNIDTYTLSCDITNENEVIETIKFIYEQLGHIDILVNCAAINPIPKEGEDNSFENYNLDRWKATLDVNITGTFLLSRECIKYMLKNQNDGFKGIIVNVTSQLGLVSPNQKIYNKKYIKPADYSVAASGVISLTRYLACYYGGKIKVNCLIPSMVENGQSEDFIKNAEKWIPFGRMSKKNEFNGAVRFLCSDDSPYMLGQALICDGGYLSW